MPAAPTMAVRQCTSSACTYHLRASGSLARFCAHNTKHDKTPLIKSYAAASTYPVYLINEFRHPNTLHRCAQLLRPVTGQQLPSTEEPAAPSCCCCMPDNDRPSPEHACRPMSCSRLHCSQCSPALPLSAAANPGPFPAAAGSSSLAAVATDPIQASCCWKLL